MGKDISGTGMDPNIIARPVSPLATAPDTPRITRILVRDLSAASQGNADGIGLADFTTRRLVEKMNRRVTYIGATTGGAPEGAKIPIYYDTDRQAIDAALKTIGWVRPEEYTATGNNAYFSRIGEENGKPARSGSGPYIREPGVQCTRRSDVTPVTCRTRPNANRLPEHTAKG